jgi:glutamyl-tRNA reductase
MAILAYGLSFRTAPIELRERIAFPEEALVQALHDVRAHVPGVREVAILSTCNRTELYCALDQADHQAVANWLAEQRHIDRPQLDTLCYAHWNRDAARHLMRVAAGLDSQVLGEPQIMGQFKDACDLANHAGTMGPELHMLSQLTLNVAKRIRTDTDIGRNPVSVAFAAVQLAQQIFSNLKHSKALLLGAGDTIELVANHLQQAGIQSMTIANRTLGNARQLADRFGGDALPLTDAAAHLHEYDVVIASTGSPNHVLATDDVAQAMRKRRHRPMFIVDIAVPRDIEPDVADLRDVFLYSIDDLTQIIELNMQDRIEAAAAAEQLVNEGADKYRREQRIHEARDLLLSFRSQAETIQEQELQRALQQLRNGGNAEQILTQFSRTLTNKLIHPPTIAIREATADGREELLDFVQSLYNLDPNGDHRSD